MKKKYKNFLNTCNLDLENQVCYKNEFDVVMKLMEKGFIDDIEMDAGDGEGSFLIWLSKKGLKKATKIQKKRGTDKLNKM